MIIVDTNIIVYFQISGEMTQLALDIRKKDPDWAAPVLWRSELRNVLALYIRNGHLDLTTAKQMAIDAEALVNISNIDISSIRILELAASSGCSAYDCEFVAVAEKWGVPLVTTDKKVLNAFPSIAVSPLDLLQK